MRTNEVIVKSISKKIYRGDVVVHPNFQSVEVSQTDRGIVVWFTDPVNGKRNKMSFYLSMHDYALEEVVISSLERGYEVKHKYKMQGDRALIFIYQRKSKKVFSVKVSLNRLDDVLGIGWNGSPRSYVGNKNEGLLLHRLICSLKNNLGKGQVVDHLDGNKTNNVDQNLRICSHQQNVCNAVCQRVDGSRPLIKGMYRINDNSRQGYLVQIESKGDTISKFFGINSYGEEESYYLGLAQRLLWEEKHGHEVYQDRPFLQKIEKGRLEKAKECLIQSSKEKKVDKYNNPLIPGISIEKRRKIDYYVAQVIKQVDGKRYRKKARFSIDKWGVQEAYLMASLKLPTLREEVFKMLQ